MRETNSGLTRIEYDINRFAEICLNWLSALICSWRCIHLMKGSIIAFLCFCLLFSVAAHFRYTSIEV